MHVQCTAVYMFYMWHTPCRVRCCCRSSQAAPVSMISQYHAVAASRAHALAYIVQGVADVLSRDQ
jgi:hypothetical protein